MSYTIISARYADADNAAALAVTEEAGVVAVSAIDTPDEWADLMAWGTPDAYQEPPVDLAAYAADKRWRVETGGITVGGVPVATDDRSKLMITGARIKADADPDFVTRWKTPDGFVTLNAATIIAISDAVLAHVDACFAAEAAVLAGIGAGTITSTAQIDAADWPS